MTAWDKATLEDLQNLSRRDDCLDIMVPSDLRYIIGRYAECVSALEENRNELELYEAEVSGEHYNNPTLNEIIQKARGDV